LPTPSERESESVRARESEREEETDREFDREGGREKASETDLRARTLDIGLERRPHVFLDVVHLVQLDLLLELIHLLRPPGKTTNLVIEHA